MKTTTILTEDDIYVGNRLTNLHIMKEFFIVDAVINCVPVFGLLNITSWQLCNSAFVGANGEVLFPKEIFLEGLNSNTFEQTNGDIICAWVTPEVYQKIRSW